MEMKVPEEKASILVVDDTPDNLSLIHGLLKKTYRVLLATDGEKALRIARDAVPPDLLLLDVMMPGLSGWDVCEALKADKATKDIPIIFLTAMTGTADETKGLELGAVDFITKPVNPPILLARVATHMKVKAASDFLRDNNSFLEAEVARRTKELAAIQDVTILAMASLAETRDSDTGNHIRRTQHYMKILAERLADNPRIGPSLDQGTISTLYKSAPLHDIGKVGIPDRILLKPGKYTPEEFEIMKTHTTMGRDAIIQAEAQLGMDVDFLRCAKEIAYSHQEKWDGSGYPEGITGEAIPLSARLMAVADVYDALISRRVYKEGMSHDKAVGIILIGKGSHFDPDIVDAFLTVAEDFKSVAARFGDSDTDMAKKAQQLSTFSGT